MIHAKNSLLSLGCLFAIAANTLADSNGTLTVRSDEANGVCQGDCAACEGNCRTDDDCRAGLTCFRRFGSEPVPGCRDDSLETTRSRTSFCVLSDPFFDGSVILADDSQPLVYKGEDPPEYFKPLRSCEGNCRSDDDCRAGLFCFQREAGEVVPGCHGDSEKDGSNSNYCTAVRNRPAHLGSSGVTVPPPLEDPVSAPAQAPEEQDSEGTPVSEPAASPTKPSDLPPLRNFGSAPPRNRFPLNACEGDCDKDSDCASGLYCHKREKAYEDVPGCYGGGLDESRTDYCAVGESQPTQPPYFLPTPPEGEITYTPGKLTTKKYELLLSEGLDARLVAVSHELVRFDDGSKSTIKFHGRPDGAATFPDLRPGHEGEWAYVSNSEEPDSGKGGVGALYFDKEGNLVDYKMLLEGTTMNCGGGRSPWNTWVSCEEFEQGQAWQVDPFGDKEPKVMQVGRDRGSWESFAYDIRDERTPHFYVTEDNPAGALARHTPSNPNWNDPWSIVHGEGEIEYLVLLTIEGKSDDGTFFWSKNRNLAKGSAAALYPGSEGIDCRDGMLYVVCKTIRMLFILDLDAQTWIRKSTLGGLFDGTPDQVQRIVGDTRNMIYMTEEASLNAGIHARDDHGRFYVILESPVLPGETTGLAFSPDGKHMFVAYQDTGNLFQVWRRDGLPFQAERLDVKFHHVPE